MLLGIYGAYVTTHLIAADASLISELGGVGRLGRVEETSLVRGQGLLGSNPNVTISMLPATADTITELFFSLEKSKTK